MTILNQADKAWLKHHKNRSIEWFKERKRDGFHVHHLDGNDKNDHWKNLLLIDGIDHLAIIHGLKKVAAGKFLMAGGKGGMNCRKNMTKEQASEIGRKAANVRWSKAVMQAGLP